MKSEDLADLTDLLRVYCESFPAESEADILRVKALEHFKNQTGQTNILPYLVNRRGAGRKPIIDDQQKERIKALRESGLKMQAIADQTGFSIGSIHAVLNPGTRK